MSGNENELKKVEKEEVQKPEGVEFLKDRKVFVPRSDIYEKDSNVVIVLDMPGVDENSVDISLEKNVLTITGGAGEERVEGFSLDYREYEPGDYERAFTVSDNIDRENISAKVKDGVLTLTLPKSNPSTKKIEVSAD